MRKALFITGILVASAQSSLAAQWSCPDTGVIVDAPRSEIAEKICRATEKAARLFATCNMPPPPKDLHVNVVEVLQPGCMALYHCGEEMIEVLAPDLMEERRSSDSAFSMLSLDAFFDSVIAHELAHAAFEAVPCPFSSCIVADEYLAYGMQVMSLQTSDKEAFEHSTTPDARVSRDDLSAVLFFMDPNRFAQKAWAHLSQQADPCAFIGQIVEGAVLLDRERF